MRRFFSFLAITSLLTVLSTSAVNAQGIKPKIQSAFQQFSNNPALANGLGSLTVINSKTGEMVFEGNNKIGMPTASTLKVITSITALDLLGPDFSFATKLFISGEIDSLGTLNGDIIIEGTGDPTLGSDRYPETKPELILSKWKEAIQKAGIKQVSGSIIANDQLYRGYDVPGTWMWTDIGNYYGAGVSALNWKENKLGINFQATRPGQAANVQEQDHNPAYRMINEVRTGAVGSGDNVYAYSAPYSQDIYLRGTYGADLKKTIEISVPDPALDLAYDLSKELEKDSILILDTIITYQGMINFNPQYQLPSNKQLIYTVQSPKLIQIVHWFNQKSINLYGESLLKVIGGISANKTNSAEAATMVSKYWQNKLKIAPSEINTFDGSGLSPQNRVTTHAIGQIMQYAKGRPWYADFLKSLPTINGTSMKSGTIGGTLGYTGYQKAADGQEYTFSLLVNNYQGASTAMRQAMFKLLDALK